MSIELRRDERQEQRATGTTKHIRWMLDEMGVKWGLGMGPNRSTDFVAKTEHCDIHGTISVTEDDMRPHIAWWTEGDLDFWQMMVMVRNGLTISGAERVGNEDDKNE